MKRVSDERVGSEGTVSKTRPNNLSTIPWEDLPGYGGAMKAIVQDRYGAPKQVLRLDEVDQPSVGDDDALIRVQATRVNTPDWVTVKGIPYILRLKLGLRQPRTPVRGTDVAGVVEAIGKHVTDLKPGDEVFGSSWADTLATVGTFAEFTVAPASKLIRKPARLTFEEAAASVMSGLTALIAMRDVGKVRPGTRVLINGASGAVGTFAVQIAKALGGEVTGVCSTQNLELVRSLGAEHVIDYTAEDLQGASGATTSSWTTSSTIGLHDWKSAGTHRHANSKQRRKYRWLFRGTAKDGVGRFDWPGLDRCAVRQMCGELREPECPRHTPRIRRCQRGNLQSLPAQRRPS